MTSSDRSWRIWATARMGWIEFRAEHPARILLTAVLPRAVFQCVFFTAVGGVLGGSEGGRFAFVGSLVMIATLMTATGVSDVVMLDKWSGTWHRIRSGTLRPFVVLLLRALPYPAASVALVLVSLLVGGVVSGHVDLMLDLLLWLPAYSIIACTIACAGLLAAALAAGKRADVFAGNALSYLIMLASGAFLPPGKVPWVDVLGLILPSRHGLAAIRAGIDGRPWLAEILAEVTVGCCWLLLAALVLRLQVRRARTSGHDDFA